MFYRSIRWHRGVLRPAFSKIRALTRGQGVHDDESGDEVVRLLSELTVSIPELIDMMEVRAFVQALAPCVFLCLAA